MRKLALASLLAASTAALAVPVVGLAGSPARTPGGVLPRVPVAAADEGLPAFESCDALLDWYVEKALPEVGAWGFGYPHLYFADTVVGTAAMPAIEQRLAGDVVADKAVTSSASGTNVQEAGVDEPDYAKTDGRRIVRLFDNELIVTDISGETARELGRTKLPRGVWSEQLLLVGDTVLVFANTEQAWYGDRIAFDMKMAPSNAEVLAYDIAGGEPELTSRTEYEGTLVESRLYDGTVRLVVQSGYPVLDFVQPNRRRSEREARRENRDIVRHSTIDDWLPRTTVDGKESPLVDCADVRHPTTDSGFGTLSVVTFDASRPTEHSAVAVTTSGNLAYSSSDRLYVATPVDRSVPAGIWRRRSVPSPAATEIHAFALDGKDTTYVASGTVAGQVRDRWSLDEYDGHLRVATALTHKWETTDNAVTVLREQGSKLVVTGTVRGLGPREEIQSVRWFDDLAIVVTFRQVDPLYTVDLRDPSRPQVLGELKIPGFSSYLHPLGGDRLLGLGTSADKRGATQGSQAAVFDLTNLRKPQQLSVLKFGRTTELLASQDPHAFTYVDADAIFTTVSTWYDGSSKVLRLAVGSDGTLEQTGEWPARYQTRILPLEEGRVAFVGKVIRLIDVP